MGEAVLLRLWRERCARTWPSLLGAILLCRTGGEHVRSGAASAEAGWIGTGWNGMEYGGGVHLAGNGLARLLHNRR